MANKKKWEKGASHETDFWSEWFRTKGMEWQQDYKARLDDSLPFQEYLIKYLPKSSRCSILDVGAGPLTLLGKVLPGYELDITAVDPLANEYDDILKRFRISPVIRTQYCEAERLSDKFLPESFDLVHIQNALDHSYDPLEGIKQMLTVLKKDCYIFLSHLTNEAEKEKYIGFHQWNFCREGDRFIIWNKDNRVDVAEELGDRAQLTISGDQTWNVVEIKKVR